MMPYKKWLDRIISAAQDIASKEFQEEAWVRGGKFVSCPDEIYQVLMEDCTPDLFFEIYGKSFTTRQTQCWDELRSQLQNYYDKMLKHPDLRYVLGDPQWGSVREAAERFVKDFSVEESLSALLRPKDRGGSQEQYLRGGRAR